MGYERRSDLTAIDELCRNLRDSSHDANRLGLTVAAYLIDVARTAIENADAAPGLKGSPATPCSRQSRSGPPAVEDSGS